MTNTKRKKVAYSVSAVIVVIVAIFLFIVPFDGRRFVSIEKRSTITPDEALVRASVHLSKNGYHTDNMVVGVRPGVFVVDSLRRFGVYRADNFRHLHEVATYLQGKQFYAVVFYIKESVGGIINVFVDASNGSILYVDNLG